MQLDLFRGIFDSSLVSTISPSQFLLCVGIALAVGLFLAFTYSYRSNSSKSFIVTLATLPAIVCVVIMMVNGNVGTGVAVAGAFSLVRFRSVPGSAEEIRSIFVAMSTGLMLGMGYLGYAILFTIIVCVCTLLYNHSRFGEKKNLLDKTITVTIPEDLNYTDVFDDIFEKFTKTHTITRVKTTNMGSLFKITYNIKLNDISIEKNFIDEIRTRNGNLEVAISPLQTAENGL